MDLQKEREAFEEVFPCSTGTVLNECGHYESQVNHKDAMIQNISWVVWQAAKANAVLEVKKSRRITLTCAQLREAFMFGAPDKDDKEQLETEMTIVWSENGHSGKGYYCYYADLPEEGSIFLDGAIEPQEPK